MTKLFVIFLGGGLGSMFRYLVSKLINEQFVWGFPLGTFTVNVLGCFFIGLILASLEKYESLEAEWGLMLATGFCGGFTTFSTFALENNTLLQQKAYGLFVAYVLASLILGVVSVFFGFWLIKKI
ncbi:fluoride efflux transporter CrcB [Rapidithrix thailandica]|uniref:Fluoride-specific ion channel FluC n=1 Tax=Rapidithrix thailandica TaxID=413964 RepID=A0AAW9SEG6_9BACT